MRIEKDIIVEALSRALRGGSEDERRALLMRHFPFLFERVPSPRRRTDAEREAGAMEQVD